ncbi:MAG: hypothetical protein Ta2B_05170 [Termitinemataceae bacterium]|nr:MAG: hypothetical protein Ta2B_05170 [Termitinemataceae bacterium]
MNLFSAMFAVKKHFLCSVVMICLMISACSKTDDTYADNTEPSRIAISSADIARLEKQLELSAETERGSGFTPGLGLAESTARENLGDYAGAVVAAYKELLWAYSYSNVKDKHDEVSVTKESVQEGLRRVKKLYSAKTDDVEWQKALHTAEAVMLFNEGEYSSALPLLSEIFAADIQTDSFANWMILVCKIEMNQSEAPEAGAHQLKSDKRELEMYSSIRARYMTFPAYWYYGAHAFDKEIATDFSQRCINLNPKGPYSDAARLILAHYAGLSEKESSLIMSRKEIEDTITQSINAANPELLAVLLPLISLRDNPFTLFASSALRLMSVNDLFKNWFVKQEDIAKRGFGTENRLSDRLSYIIRG